MARMYSRKKGKSGSKKPLVKKVTWVKYKNQEIEEIIIKLASKGKQTAEIGLILRDQYGIPSTRTVINKKIKAIMKEKNIYSELPEDLFNLIKRAVNLHSHMDRNKKDYTSKRGLGITESKIRRLAKYYKSKGVLDKKWKYDAEQAKLLVK